MTPTNCPVDRETLHRILRLKSDEELRRGPRILTWRIPQDVIDREIERRRHAREYAAQQRERGEC
jgi:hypothetical protein